MTKLKHYLKDKASQKAMEEKLQKLCAVKAVYEQVLEEKQCVSLKTLAVSGRDLMEQAGMSSGKELGEMLKMLLEVVVEDPALNKKEVLISKAKEILKNSK